MVVNYAQSTTNGLGVEIDRLTALEIKVVKHLLLSEIINSTKQLSTVQEQEAIKNIYHYRLGLFQLLQVFDGEEQNDVGNARVLVNSEQITDDMFLSLNLAIHIAAKDNSILNIISGLPPMHPYVKQGILNRILAFVSKAT